LTRLLHTVSDLILGTAADLPPPRLLC